MSSNQNHREGEATDLVETREKLEKVEIVEENSIVKPSIAQQHTNGTDNGQVDGTVEKPSDEDVKDAGSRGISGDENGIGSSIDSRLVRMPVSRDALRYSSSHLRRGHCVIFNHRYFDRHTGLGERNGTDRDRDQMQQLFNRLGFDVQVHNNLSVADIKAVIQDYAFGKDHSNCDMFIAVFMSHGEQEILWGRDDHFKADYLFDHFTSDQCKTLAGKPKIFFIQACRGDRLDTGVTLVRSQPSDETDSGHLAYKIPNSADFLICWSTVPGHYSWRNTTNGSWFVQSLVHVLGQSFAHDDLLSILTSVNRHMIINFESNCPSQQHMHGKKQTASIVSTLMRKIYLQQKY